MTTGTRADAIELLTSHHRDVEQLWKQAEAARGTGSHDLAADLGRRIITLLSQHDAIETQLLYPTLRDAGVQGDELADHSLEEHQEIREHLKMADRGDLHDDEAWGHLREGIEAVQHHVAEEEGRIFPLLKAHVDGEDLHELGDAMQKAMALAPTHPHPTTPNNAIGANIVGPLAGVFDRMRDALKKAS